MIIYGYGGHGRVVADCLEKSHVKITAVFDDHLEVECPYLFLGKYQPGIQETDPIILAVGDNATRQQIAERVKHRPGIVQHPSAIVSTGSRLGAGAMVMARAVIQTHVEIGLHCIINTGAIVEHDCRIGNFVHIATGAIVSGGVVIGDSTFVGAGAILLPGINIGRNCMIGAGAVVLASVPDGLTLVGNPARQLNNS